MRKSAASVQGQKLQHEFARLAYYPNGSHMEREMKSGLMGHIFVVLTIAVIMAGIFMGCSMREQLVFSHPSFTQKQCTLCHLPKNFGDSHPDEVESQVPADGFEGQINAWRLIAPQSRLCFKCHEYGNMKDGFPEKLWQHAPAAQRDCTFCHNPHFSENPFMLRESPSAICSSKCHMDGYMSKIEAHQKSGECLDCHNAHIGINHSMLRKEYHEDWEPPKESWTESRSAGME